MPQPNPNRETLVALLSTLPPELRLTIYELCLPFLRHRRSKVLADYISDSHWMAISPAVFNDAAPLVFSKRLVYIYTRLRPGPTLVETLDDIITRSYPNDHEWVRPVARSMLRKLALTIQFPNLQLVGLSDDLSAYFAGISTLTGLKELQISLGPEFLPTTSLNWPTLATAYDTEKLSSSLAVHMTSELIRMMETVAVVKRCVSPECKVVWRFDRAGMPSLPKGCSPTRTLQELAYFNDIMAWLWEYGESLYIKSAPGE